MKWRVDEDVDSILNWQPPPGFTEDYSYEISGRDNDGHPSKHKFMMKSFT